MSQPINPSSIFPISNQSNRNIETQNKLSIETNQARAHGQPVEGGERWRRLELEGKGPLVGDRG
jgi:hypothetical protein